SQRYGNFSYSIPLAGGTYDVTLKLAENTFSSKGKRVFDVFAQGNQVLKDLDIYAIAGKNRALDLNLRVVVSGGTLNLDFVPVVGDAQVNGLVIRRAASDPPTQPRGSMKRYYSTQQR
ncbi:MAG TPA: malectin domain-containing carbohydrate-binding protein, partial [Thermodesulfobacteriota bacterium]|nr:malectin domain-containing carbohydrate-binding protein [Thermodesulfobacteriota bacterium]